MGAYENPQVIQEPNYGQIFISNFQAGFAQQQAVKDRAEKRREKQKMEDQKLADRQLAFDANVGKIEAGDATSSLQQFGYLESDNYSENERLWQEGKISRDEYSRNRSNSFRKIQELAQIGKALDLQSKNFDKLDESAFQNDPRSVALAKAWKEQKMKFKYVGNDVELYFKDGDKDVIVDIDDLKNDEFFNINDKYKLADATLKNLTQAATITKNIKNRSVTDANGNIISSGVESYDKDTSVYINQIVKSDKMSKLFENKDDAGSLFKDDVYEYLKANNKLEETANKIIKEQGLKNVMGFKKAFMENKAYDNPAYRDVLDEVSKNVIAERAFNNYLPPAKQLKTPMSGFKSASPGAITPTSAAQAIETAALDPVTFYNTQITTSPYGDSNEGATSTTKPGVFVIKSQGVDSQGGLVQMPDRPLDLTNRDAFGKYIGTIMNRHRSVVGSSAEVRAAVNKYTTKKEIDRLYKNFMDSLPKEEELENSDIQNQFGVSPDMAKAIGDNLKLSNENNDFSQQK
jgi:hypothetical protein